MYSNSVTVVVDTLDKYVTQNPTQSKGPPKFGIIYAFVVQYVACYVNTPMLLAEYPLHG